MRAKRVPKAVAFEARGRQEESRQVCEQLGFSPPHVCCCSDQRPYPMTKTVGPAPAGWRQGPRIPSASGDWCCWFAGIPMDSKRQQYLGKRLVKSGFKL